MEVYDRRIDAALCKYPCDLRRTVAFDTEGEYLPYRFRALLVDHPFLFVVRIFLITERRKRGDMLSGIAFRFHDRAYLLGTVLRIHLVQDILERRDVVVRVEFAVHLVVHGDEPHVRFCKVVFSVVTHEDVVAPEPRHIFDDDGGNFSLVYIAYHSLKVGAVEVTARIPVVHIEPYVAQTVFVGVLF